MELLLDTANLAAIKKYNDYYEIVGVTTNPTILCKEKQPFFKMYEQILDIIGEEKNVIYKSRNAQEAYTKWNVYIGRKKERAPKNEK